MGDAARQNNNRAAIERREQKNRRRGRIAKEEIRRLVEKAVRDGESVGGRRRVRGGGAERKEENRDAYARKTWKEGDGRGERTTKQKRERRVFYRVLFATEP